MTRHWLMKSEPSVFSITTLAKRPKKTSPWDGVRNYQARNYMREMKIGDLVVFYHSNDAPVGAAGTAEVVKEAYPDHTSWDPKSEYYDPKSRPDAPRWFMVDVRWRSTFPRVIGLDELRENRALADMLTLRKGNRLSITPLTPGEWKAILKMAGEKPG